MFQEILSSNAYYRIVFVSLYVICLLYWIIRYTNIVYYYYYMFHEISDLRFKLKSFYYRTIPPLTYKHIENNLTKKGGDWF